MDSNVAVISIPQEPPNFRCVPVEISQDKFINVTAGDFLGVVLFRADVLPVVNNYRQDGNAPTLIYTPTSVTTIVRQGSGTVDLTSNAIHVTAAISEPGIVNAPYLAPSFSSTDH